MSDLEILVTGASKGIGRGIATHLAESGFKVLIHYGRDEAGALETKKIIEDAGGKAAIIGFDVANREEVKSKLEAYMAENSAFYGIVCNAGIAKDAAFPGMTDEDWDQVIDTNLNGFYNVLRPCVMEMIRRRKPGRIVTMSSVSGVAGNRGQVNYSASKGAIIAATKALSLELAKRKITVNCVAPGLIDTGMISDEIWSHAKAMVPMQRMGDVREVSSVVNFLMSEEASYITRQVISVNGGMI
ncbi:MAG: 3-oxoacyl-ACP reductase FabG [Bdellovibrionota bacterium]|nr:3-oxoacyl-ACP reductase FabG [Pseudobdellovibrionaceae bacterium]|tara:strand:- start:5867 stop:6595 length:729 start_codon:yes stop_codon:yes gene_type:complete